MSKVSELDRILQELKKCGESLACIAEELAEVFSGSGGAEEQKEAGGKPDSFYDPLAEEDETGEGHYE